MLDPTKIIYWNIEKYLVEIDGQSTNYEYQNPTTPPMTDTGTTPDNGFDWITTVGIALLIGGILIILYGIGKRKSAILRTQ